MSIEVRYATDSELEYLIEKDDVSEDWAQRCISFNEYIVALENDHSLGFLRYSMFWSIFPYMDMIRIEENQQRCGIGTKLFQFWEKEMKQKGADKLLTSSQNNEIEPQEWHQKNGFQKCGLIEFGNHEDEKEVFMVKFL